MAEIFLGGFQAPRIDNNRARQPDVEPEPAPEPTPDPEPAATCETDARDINALRDIKDTDEGGEERLPFKEWNRRHSRIDPCGEDCTGCGEGTRQARGCGWPGVVGCTVDPTNRTKLRITRLDLSLCIGCPKRHGKLWQLPNTIGNLEHLTHLKLSGNNLTDVLGVDDITTAVRMLKDGTAAPAQPIRVLRPALPDTLAKLVHLQSLDLNSNADNDHSNGFFALPRSFGNLTSLINFTADACDLKTVSIRATGLGNLPNLKRLSLQKNLLTELWTTRLHVSVAGPDFDDLPQRMFSATTKTLKEFVRKTVWNLATPTSATPFNAVVETDTMLLGAV
eukprot:COSAG01_NODE_3091_length_6600_cov_17.518074_2_plen_336_part_00